MGLDIHICSNVGEESQSEILKQFYQPGKLIGLSRAFCNFMCRKNAVSSEPELDQIGRITGVDISPLYDMEKYWDGDSIEMQMRVSRTPEAKASAAERIRQDQESLAGNIERVHDTVKSLIAKLSHEDNINAKLDHGERETLNSSVYFSDFNVDKGQGYIDNNFGHDLRIFDRYLEALKKLGATSVWFEYG